MPERQSRVRITARRRHRRRLPRGSGWSDLRSLLVPFYFFAYAGREAAYYGGKTGRGMVAVMRAVGMLFRKPAKAALPPARGKAGRFVPSSAAPPAMAPVLPIQRHTPIPSMAPKVRRRRQPAKIEWVPLPRSGIGGMR